jgi:hypothetical protein
MKKFLSLTLSLIIVMGLLPMGAPPTAAADPVPIVVGHTGGIVIVADVDAALSAAGLTRDGPTPFSVTFAPGVWAIGDNAFFYCTSLTSVVIGSSVTSIGIGAFEGCASLAGVVIPDSVTFIGRAAFYGCTSLTGVVIGNSVTSIGSAAFADCTNLYDIYFKSEIPPAISSAVGMAAFEGVKSGARAIVPYGATAYGAEGSLWNDLIVMWGCEECGGLDCDCYEEPVICPNCENPECICATFKSGIDYETVYAGNLIIPGRISGDGAPGYFINLTHETITFAQGFSPEAFSIDGGVKWKRVKSDTFGEVRFAKMLNKDMKLRVSNQPIARKTKRPPADAVIVAFADTKARPKAPKMAVNYFLDRDRTGDTPGYWLLVNRADAKNPSSTAQRGPGIQIGLISGKTVDDKHFGQFYAAPNHGIPVVKLEDGAKPSRTVYAVRSAPRPDGSAFLPASKSVKVKASSELKVPKFKIKAKDAKLNKDGTVKRAATADISVRAGTYVVVDGRRTLHGAKTKVDVFRAAGRIEAWSEATARKPASAKQVLTR